jgi:hypothetical protein
VGDALLQNQTAVKIEPQYAKGTSQIVSGSWEKFGFYTWGKTYEEAVEHAGEALALYLETFDELGKSIPMERGLKQPVSLGVTMRIPVIA